MNIFDYSRKIIEQKYNSQNEYFTQDNKTLKEYDLSLIDYYEKKAKKNGINFIAYTLKSFWSLQSENDKFFLGFTIAAIVFAAFVGIITFHSISNAILNVSQCFFIYTVALGVVFLCSLIKKQTMKSRAFYYVWLAFFVLSLPYIPKLFGYSTTQIGHLYEAKEYTEKYYVIFSREPEKVSSRKEYKLPAEIERRYDYVYTDENGNDYESLGYHINYLYFPNGGYLSFDYDYAYEEPSCSKLQVKQERKVTDCHGDEYYISLTKEKVD